MKDKPISEMNDAELNQAIDEKKALPDLIQKRIIFHRKKDMIDAQEILENARQKNNNFINPIHRVEFRNKIISCFLEIIGMVQEAGIDNLFNKQLYKKSDYELMLEVSQGKDVTKINTMGVSVDVLKHLCLYNLYCLHRLNLTNLFYDDNLIEPGSLEDLA